MYGSEIGSNLARKTAAFNLPVKRKRDRSWKIEPGKMVFTCFTSDFLLKDADEWRRDCWKMMRIRSDLCSSLGASPSSGGSLNSPHLSKPSLH